MTPKEFAAQLPELANNDLPIKPPFVFNGLSARVFPLRASLDTLQQVCNGYLNVVPPEAGYFRAAFPYVYLMVLDYGELSEAVTRYGWFSQMEVFFSVPVEWYKLVGGRFVFHDWAVITPYIFVNDNFSVPLGRTVYGFPKILAQVSRTESRWTTDPLAPALLARIETAVFPEVYTGKGLESRVFLEVERATTSNLRVPPDPASPMMPWVMASNLAKAVGGFGRDAMWLAQSMRIFPINAAADPRLFQMMLARMAPWFAPGGAGFIQNSLNLKQFRRSDDPAHLCYESLTNGQMRTTAFNGGGLLGEQHILLGDLSGGHSVRLYEHSSLPIMRTLGLEMERQWNDNEVSVAELKPVMPFWIDVDLIYDKGANLAWRSEDGIWKDETGAAFAGAEQPAAEAPVFVSAVATAIEAIAGPFRFTGTTIRVIPLLADKKKLQAFLEMSMNDPLRSPVVGEDGGEEHVRFEVWARPPQSVNSGDPVGGNFAYVYLTASSFSDVTSKTNNVGDWAKYELAFMIPVKWQRMSADEWKNKGDAGEWTTVGVGLVPAFFFVDQCIAAISRFEVQGLAARTATFVRPESVWLSEEGETDPEQTLLRVNVEVIPALDVGQKATTQPLIEISRGVPNQGLGQAPDTPWMWAEDLRGELGQKNGAKIHFPKAMKIARALALEVLGNQTPVSLYTLKQFRDVADPDKACYQSLVRVPRVLSEVFDVREIEDTLTVHIHDYPSLNIVEMLGIKATPVEERAVGVVYCTQGIRPFYIRATVDEPLAEHLLSRSGTTQWTLHRAAFHTMLSDEKDAPRIMVDLTAETLQDQLDPSRTANTMFQARQRTEAGPPKGVITVADARGALAVADAQIVIESLLSREWSNYDPGARWRRGRMDLLKAFSSLPLGGETKPFAEAELYRRINNLLAAPPGAVAAPISRMELSVMPGNGSSGNGQPSDPVQPGPAADGQSLTWETISKRWRTEMEGIIRNQSALTSLRLTMERSVDLLSAVAVLGVAGVQDVYKSMEKQSPDFEPSHAPTTEELLNAGVHLIQSIQAIQAMTVVGEPSPNNNLDTNALADSLRLEELLLTLQSEFKDEVKPTDSTEATLEFARVHGEELRQVVHLARSYCQVQYDALLNKLSRAYQKPDFCIRRDAVGPQRDRLLPLTLSWDEDWYYGRQIPSVS